MHTLVLVLVLPLQSGQTSSTTFSLDSVMNPFVQYEHFTDCFTVCEGDIEEGVVVVGADSLIGAFELFGIEGVYLVGGDSLCLLFSILLIKATKMIIAITTTTRQPPVCHPLSVFSF